MRAMLIVMVLAAMAGAALARSPEWRWPHVPGLASPPVPSDNPMSPVKVALGRLLFYDADLSIDGTMSCATCHEQKRGFADGNRTRPGVHGDPGRRNVPGLANAAWLSPLTWADPGLTTLEAQTSVPLFGDRPVEMGMKGSENELTRRLSRNSCYVSMFRKAFPEKGGRIELATMAMAIAAFERSLVSFNSPWDRGTVSDAASRGAALFQGSAGCSACHAGPNFTDARYHRLVQTGGQDQGLAEKTGLISDRGRFRTPSLRNVAVTAPYLHDGSAADLQAAIRAHGADLSERDEGGIVAFLEALTDRHFLSDPAHAMPLRACGKRL